jgi:hypothetical protein
VSAYLQLERRDDFLQVNLQGEWVFANLGPLQQALDAIEPGDARQVRFSCGGLHGFDLAGAWILYEKSMDFDEVGIKTEYDGFRDTHFKFLQHIIDLAAQDVPLFDPGPIISFATARAESAPIPSSGRLGRLHRARGADGM